jgi:glycine cleavage system H lipoate-binding protein/TusA-related sulfurtransferase
MMEVEGCVLPEDRLYDLENSVWLQEAPGGEVTLGLMATLAAFAGKFVGVTYRPIEGPIEAGRSVATVESIRYTGAVRLPVRATVVARNPEIGTRPKLLNDSPYDRGWIARLQPEAVDAWRGPPLATAAAIVERLRSRIREERIRCFPAFPDVELIEIGTECSATLAQLDDLLGQRQPEEIVLLVTDDPTSPIELVRWSDRTGHSVLGHRTEGSLHQFTIRKEPDPQPRRRQATGRG